MITHITAFILGIIEGFTEFLPISSTAHLILASDILRVAQSNFTKTFEIVIQSGAILAVVALYWRRFLEWESVKKIIVAFIPTGVLGLGLYKIIKTFLLGDITIVLWSLAVGGVALILFERLFTERNTAANIKDITYRQAVGVGFFQAAAVIPGVSRSAATIVGGMVMGLRRDLIVEFSFLLAAPTMLAATGFDLVKNASLFSTDQVSVLVVGFFVSFLTAIISIKFLLGYIRHHSFTAFGIYRILLALAFFYLISIH